METNEQYQMPQQISYFDRKYFAEEFKVALCVEHKQRIVPN